jgi:hypothetical protein
LAGVGIEVGDDNGVGVLAGVDCTVGVGVAVELKTLGVAVGGGLPCGGGLTLSFDNIMYPSAPIDAKAMIIDATVIGISIDLRSAGAL